MANKWIFFERRITTASIRSAVEARFTNYKHVQQATDDLEALAKKHKGFVGPIAFDAFKNEFIVAFSDPTQAMLFKLKTGGEA